MKKVLITGKDSYIGNAIEEWLSKDSGKYLIETVDMKNESWREKDFSLFDVIIHVAGIAHIRETRKNRNDYFTVNRDLAIDTARKAKDEGVKQFVFLSTMNVYGMEKGIIRNDTEVNPKSAYGLSKLEAERGISSLKSDQFLVAILRPPMVYGPNCRGNYPRLSKLTKILPFFPKVENKRSAIYIYNLTEFIKKIIDHECEGLFFPQNREYYSTHEMVEIISECNGRRIRLTKIFNPIITRLNIGIVNKLFGDLFYDKTMSEYVFDYIICNFGDSIRESEDCNTAPKG